MLFIDLTEEKSAECAAGGAKRSTVFVESHVSGSRTSAGMEEKNGFSKPKIIQQKAKLP